MSVRLPLTQPKSPRRKRFAPTFFVRKFVRYSLCSTHIDGLWRRSLRRDAKRHYVVGHQYATVHYYAAVHSATNNSATNNSATNNATSNNATPNTCSASVNGNRQR